METELTDQSVALADDVSMTTESVAGAPDNDEEPSGEEIVDEHCRPVPDPLDEALEAVENLDVRVKDEPLENVGDILMDDELRLQLEESIDMVVNELSTPDNVAASENFADGAEAANECGETTSAANSSIDSMNDLEGTLDPDLQAVCDVLRMATSSPTMRRRSAEKRGANTTLTASSADVNVKREPRDSTLANLLSAVESLPSTATVSSSNEIDRKRRQSNPIDLLTMLSLEKKPSALSILPVNTDKSAPEKFSTLPSVTIKSVPASVNSSRPTNEEYVKHTRRPPNLLPVDGKIFARSPDSFSSSVSLPHSSSSSSSSSSISSPARTTNSSNLPPACCPTLPNRTTDMTNPYMLYNRATSSARPSSCSYASYACRRVSPYPPPPYPSMSYVGMRSPGSRIVGPFSVASVPTAAATAPPPRPFYPNPSTLSMNGGCCTSIAPSVPPSMVLMNSKPNNCPALPPLPLSTCRLPLSPTSPSFARSREYASAYPDTTAAAASSSSDSLASIQQAFRPRSTWAGPQNGPPHGVTSRALSLPSPKSGRGSSSSMPVVVQPSNAPSYKNHLLATGGSSANFNFPVATSSQNGNVVGAPTSVANAYEDFSAASGMPFQRAQCCFSSQIQCFNSACDNAAAQQHVSIIQHSTRLSNLKSNSMDSISSLLQYHSYFKKY